MSPSLKLFSTRRHFLSRLGLFGLASSLPIRRFLSTSDTAVLASSRTPSTTAPTVKNRAPLAPNAFSFLPLTSIRPAGWLEDQLRIQANGLSGHLDETWDDVGPNSGWLGGTGESWERGPYYLDGLVPLAYLLDDPAPQSKSAALHRLDP